MKKLNIIVLFFASILAFPALAQALEQDTTQLELTSQQQTTYQQLQTKASNLNVSWNEHYTVPKWVRLTNLAINWRSEDYTERAYQFLGEYGALYKITDPKQVLRAQSQKQDKLGLTHVTLQQVSDGVPVFAGQLQFNFRPDGTIVSIHGNIIPGVSSINSKPTISAKQAQQIAKQAVPDQSDLQTTEPILYYYNHGIFSKKKESTYLVWTFSVYSKAALIDFGGMNGRLTS